jgi:hypothetical protein
MLSNKEKEYLKEVLKLIPEEDLHLLALVVTNNMIIPVTTEGKLNVKCQNTPGCYSTNFCNLFSSLLYVMKIRDCVIEIKLNVIICCLTEALDAILLHSDTMESVLQRRRVSKEILFRYLHNNKIAINPSSDKWTMISTILQMWNYHPCDEVIELTFK